MSFTDDHISPATPSPRGGGSDAFDAPDIVWQSPTTAERVVDTQSGFLVVVRMVDSRLALSVKRRLGTPPVSSILLTPDESLKLSKILADHPSEQLTSSRVARTLSPEIEDWLKQFSSTGTTASPKGLAQERETKKRERAIKRRVLGNRITFTVLVVVVVYAAFMLLQYVFDSKRTDTHVVKLATSSGDKVDKFVRSYVSNMLDFNPGSYRLSQVQAMAVMAPELMEKYWQETNFPLTARQLKSLPQGKTVLITKVTQNNLDDKHVDVDLYAELANSSNKTSSPVHLQLNLALDENNIHVLEQKDLTQ